MNKFVFGITFILYVLFIDYVTSMLIFDFRKYIKKDKLLKDLKFSIKWKEVYAQRKAYERLKKEYKLDFIENSKNIAK